MLIRGAGGDDLQVWGVGFRAKVIDLEKGEGHLTIGTAIDDLQV